MPKYRKKPVVIEAMEFIGPDLAHVDYLVAFDEWVAERQGEKICRYKGSRMIIPTLEGDMEAQPGDWIVCGTAGELYPVKPSIFADIYEPVTEEP